MDKATDAFDMEAFEEEFEREIMHDDDSASREILASGRSIHICRDDTPAGHLIRVDPDGTETLVRFDWDEAAKILGA